MPLSFGVPRSTHTWLRRLYDYLDKGVKTTVPSGASGVANGAWLGSNVPVTQVGNATGVVGLYGFSGLPQVTGYGLGQGVSGGSNLWSGSSGILATGIGGSGLMQALSQFGWNGGTGALVSLNEIVRSLKNAGLITP